MGLDARVYCNCFENGNIRSQPKSEWNVFVDADGSRNARTSDFEAELAFDRWSHSACEHEGGVYMSAPLGNISLVATLRGELHSSGVSFPVLLERVLYNGTHGGDFIPMELMPQLRSEVDQLSAVISIDSRTQDFLKGFENTMRNLSECARGLDKTIAF